MDCDEGRVELHLAEGEHGLHSLNDHGAGAHQEHHDGEEGVKAAFIKKPEGNTEELKERKGLHKLLSEHFLELLHGDEERIFAEACLGL